MAAIGLHAEEAGLPLHGFTDAGGGFSSRDTPDNQKINGFKIGTIDFYLSPEFDDGVKALMEIAFEPAHSTGEIVIDVERLQVGYTFNDYLTLWAGRFHTPFGAFNTAYHHGSQFQTSIYRPKFIDFEDAGGILPVHSVGLWGKGQLRLDNRKIAYNVYAANGSKILLDSSESPGKLDMNNYRNDKSHYMIGGSVAYDIMAGAMEGLEVGAHGFSSDVGSYTKDDYSVASTNASRVNMYGGFLHYDQHKVEFLAEYYGFSDKNQKVANSKSIKSNAQFTQLGYNVTDIFTGYGRFEKTALNQNDLYFKDQVSGRSYTRYAVGIKKDINPRAAFKLEWITTPHDGGATGKYNIFQYNYAIRF